jgi:hypothetical protein
MPRFLPPVGGGGWGAHISFEKAEGFRDDFMENVVEPLQHVMEQMGLPSWHDYKEQLTDTAFELYQAGRSLGQLIYITLRPLVILSVIVAQYVYRSTTQLTMKFIDFQRSLDPFVLLCEGLAIVALVGLYLLRRFIRQRRYIPRLKKYFKTKQQLALQKYNNFIAKIAETSTFLAFVLPHLFFVVLVALLYSNKWGRYLVRLFSEKIPTRALFTLWMPVIKTVMLVASYHKRQASQTTSTGSKRQAPKPDTDKRGQSSKTDEAPKSAVTSKKSVLTLVSRYSSNLSNNNTSDSVTERSDGPRSVGASTNPAQPLSNEEALEYEVLQEEMSDLLKYWIVYSFVVAMFIFASQVPFVSRFLSPVALVVEEDDEEPTARFASKGASFVLSYWSLRGVFLNDLRFLVLIWAWLFTSIAKAQHHNIKNKTSSKSKADSAATRKGSKGDATVWYSSSPIDYIYHRIASALHMIDASSTAASTISGIVGQKMDTLLGAFVLVNVLSSERKDTVVRVFKEGTKYLPCAMTLLMPGYFANLGGVYASLVVAAGYSIQVLDKRGKGEKMKTYEKFEKPSQTTKHSNVVDATMIDHLQYYVVLHCIHRTLAVALWDNIILATPLFRFVLYWIPFQNHIRMVFLLWLQVSLLNGAKTLYSIIEWEFVALGLVNKACTSLANHDIPDNAQGSVTARLFTKAMSSLPVGDDSRSTIVKDEDKGSTATDEKEETNGAAANEDK